MSLPLSLISDADLAEHWFSFRVRTWRKVCDVVRGVGREQKEIARRISMDEGQFSKIMSGRRNVTLRTLHNIARAADHRLEVSLVPLNSLPKPNYHYEDSPQIATFEKKSGDRNAWLERIESNRLVGAL